MIDCPIAVFLTFRSSDTVVYSGPAPDLCRDRVKSDPPGTRRDPDSGSAAATGPEHCAQFQSDTHIATTVINKHRLFANNLISLYSPRLSLSD